MRTLRPLAGSGATLARAGRFGLPVFAVAASCGAFLMMGASQQRVLMALPVPAFAEPDSDFDGLSDFQEKILYTKVDEPDSDSDGFDDLVELARGTDPNNANSIPGPQTVHVGMTAREENGMVTLVSAVYAAHGQFPWFGFKLGVAFGGVESEVPTNVLLSASALTLHPTLDPSGWILVLETPVPQSLIVGYGYFGAYALVSEGGSAIPHAAAALNLFGMDGEVVALGPAPMGVGGGTGSIYQPLGRGEDLPASAWEDGRVCYQYTEVVGTDGSSVILDIEDATCEPLDSSCNMVHCQGGIGTTVKVLDAGALAGGG